MDLPFFGYDYRVFVISRGEVLDDLYARCKPYIILAGRLGPDVGPYIGRLITGMAYWETRIRYAIKWCGCWTSLMRLISNDDSKFMITKDGYIWPKWGHIVSLPPEGAIQLADVKKIEWD